MNGLIPFRFWFCVRFWGVVVAGLNSASRAFRYLKAGSREPAGSKHIIHCFV